MPSQTKAERTAINKLEHYEKRQAERAERGPRGLAESWIERARAIAARLEEEALKAGGDPAAAWNDLARTAATWVARYEQ